MKVNRREFLSATAATALASSVDGLHLLAAEPVRNKRLQAIAFDALVIFDLAVVSQRAEELFPGRGSELTSLWRTRQFEYTWLRTAAGRYEDFWHVTQDALVYAAGKMKLALSGVQRDQLMDAYRELRVWPDVPNALTKLHADGFRMAFLSNFTAEMISVNLKRVGLSDLFEEHLTTDRVAAFKPSPRAYQMGVNHFKVPKEDAAFMAFAPWDVAGAKWFGYPTFWINRANALAEELGVGADVVAPDLSAPEVIRTCCLQQGTAHELVIG